MNGDEKIFVISKDSLEKQREMMFEENCSRKGKRCKHKILLEKRMG